MIGGRISASSRQHAAGPRIYGLCFMSPELGFPGDPGQLIRDGLLVEVHIGHAQKREAPGQHLHPQRALIDTGASDCCVDIDLAEQLQLKKVDRDAVTGVTGERLIVDVAAASRSLRRPRGAAG